MILGNEEGDGWIYRGNKEEKYTIQFHKGRGSLESLLWTISSLSMKNDQIEVFYNVNHFNNQMTKMDQFRKFPFFDLFETCLNIFFAIFLENRSIAV